MFREPQLAEAVVALVTGSALLLAVATAAVMVRDSRTEPSTVPAPVVAEAPAPPPAAPSAVEPRFPAEQEEQPSVQEETKAQREQNQNPFPAPVAPSVDLLGPAPVDMRFAIYLASFSSEEQAHAGWEILERRYRRPLSGLSPLVRRGKSRQGATVYRLFAGPFESLPDATQRCAALSTATANCKPADLSEAGKETGSWD